MKSIIKTTILSLFISILFFNITQAENIHKLVIQINTKNLKTQKIALNNVVNVQKFYGIDNVIIEVVVYGPGIGLLTKKSKQKKRVTSLIVQNVIFTACENTIETIKRRTGRTLKLLKGVKRVKSGVARIMELQEKGYSYVKP